MDALAQLNSALADRYQIERELGRGGMATVFLARDVRHTRKVALKVLDSEIAAVLGVERFLAEIRVTANLQHPNLLPLFDSGAANGVLYYVMPYADGESLRARLDREHQLPVDEAVRIAVAIAGALDYAHRHGIVHRDLKPENILLQAGQPVVADFGIALAVSNAGGTRITQTGLSLGTPQYMSPEQATGDRVIDGRSDIYSLGAVLYEMLVGEPPHIGHSVQAVIAKVLTDKPQSTRSRRESVPAQVDAAVMRALSKLAADRFTTTAEFAESLQSRRGATTGEQSSKDGLGRRATVTTRHKWTIASMAPWILATAAIALAVWVVVARRSIEPLTTRFVLVLPRGSTFWDIANNSLAISPAGNRIAYLAVGPGASSQVFIRSIDKLDQVAITTTEAPRVPAFSPDGQWVVYANQSEIKKVSITGGPPVTLARTLAVYGISWGTPSTIVASIDDGTLVRIRADGGSPVPIVKQSNAVGEIVRRWPLALSDGKSVIVAAFRGADARIAELRQVSIQTGEEVPLGISGCHPLGVIGDQLVYAVANGAIMAVRYDVARGRVSGSPIPVVDRVYVDPTSGGAKAALSASGSLVYFGGGPASELVLVSGNSTSPLFSGEPRDYANPRFSPDGRRVAVGIRSANGSDIWIYDRKKTTLTQLTKDGGLRPEWSPDGRHVLFIKETPRTSVWQQLADGSGPAEPLLQRDDPWEAFLSPDSKYLIFRTGPGAAHNRDILGIRLGDSVVFPIVESPFVETQPRLSPDGHWLAYVSIESGRAEIYVRPFPQQGSRVQVSADGGREPMWAPSGKTLFYRHASSFVGVTVTTSPTFSVGARTIVPDIGYASASIHQSYDVAPDGKSFLLLRDAGEGTQAIVVLNWARELKARVAPK